MSTLHDLVNSADDDIEEPSCDPISLENDYIESEDLCLEIYRCEDALEQLFSIEKRVEDQYGLLSDMAYDSIKNTTKAVTIKETICSIISPIGLTYEMPSIESIGWYMDDSDLTVSLEGVGDALRKIRDFIVKIFNRLIEAVKKFFRWLRGLFGKTKENNKIVKKQAEKKLEIAKKMPQTKPTQTVDKEKEQKEKDKKTEKRKEQVRKINDIKDKNKKVTEKDVIEVVKNEEPLDGPIFDFGNLLPMGVEKDSQDITDRIGSTAALVGHITEAPSVLRSSAYRKLKQILIELHDEHAKSTEPLKRDEAIQYCEKMVNAAEIIFKEQFDSFKEGSNKKVDREDFIANIYETLLGDSTIYYAHGGGKWVVRKDNDLFIEETKNYANAGIADFGFHAQKIKNFKSSKPVMLSNNDYTALLTVSIFLTEVFEKVDIDKYIASNENDLKIAADSYKILKDVTTDIVDNNGIKSYTIPLIRIGSEFDYRITVAGVSNQLKVLRLLISYINSFHKVIAHSKDSEYEELRKQILSNMPTDF